MNAVVPPIAIDGRDRVNKVYDMTCGGGGILLQATKILGNDGVTSGYFGQEINPTTYNLARINMFLHGIDFDKFDIALGDTLTEPAERSEIESIVERESKLREKVNDIVAELEGDFA